MTSTKTLEALRIIDDHGPITPRHFARLMWPASKCWSHHTKCGPNGVSMGGGMSLAGGGFLGKLSHKKLIGMSFSPDGYVLLKAGREALNGTKTE